VTVAGRIGVRERPVGCYLDDLCHRELQVKMIALNTASYAAVRSGADRRLVLGGMTHASSA